MCVQRWRQRRLETLVGAEQDPQSHFRVNICSKGFRCWSHRHPLLVNHLEWKQVDSCYLLVSSSGLHDSQATVKLLIWGKYHYRLEWILLLLPENLQQGSPFLEIQPRRAPKFTYKSTYSSGPDGHTPAEGPSLVEFSGIYAYTHILSEITPSSD